MTQTNVPRIAIVEDDGTLAFMLDEMCKSAGYEVVGCVGNAADALTLADREKPDVAILDFNLDGGLNGLELIGELKKDHPETGTILVTGWDINDIASRMEGVQPDRILRKPVSPHVLTEVIEQISAMRFTANKRDLRLAHQTKPAGGWR